MAYIGEEVYLKPESETFYKNGFSPTMRKTLPDSNNVMA